MSERKKDTLNWLAGGGEMGKLIRAHDWSTSAVGPADEWPQSLKTSLSICLGSKFPMFVWWGPELTVFYNDGYIPFTAQKHPEYLGRSAREQWAEIWEELRPLVEQVYQTGEATWAENMRLFMTRKGFLEETYFTFSYSPIRDESGAVAGIINPCQETTELVIGARRLTLLRELGLINAKTPDSIGELCAKVLHQNEADIPFSLIYLAEAGSKTAALVGSFGIDNGLAVPVTIDLESDTKKRWVPDSAQILPIEIVGHEKPVGFVVLGISPRLAFDKSYQDFFGLVAKQITVHVSNLYAIDEEKKRAEALAEIDRAKTTFFNNVSHELRTPLTLILGPLETLIAGSKGPLSTEVQREAEVIYRNALRLLKLVNTLLDFSRIEAGREQTAFEPTDLSALTIDLVRSFHSTLETAGIELVLDCPALSEPVFVDREMWGKIVLNLLSNAFKHTWTGKIRISLKCTDAHTVSLSVQDTGIGIPEEELDKIFERFHRVQGVQARTHEGTGIGLSLVKQLVELHGGAIAVSSSLGNGSEFTVTIPLGSAHLPQDGLKKENTTRSCADTSEAFISETRQWGVNFDHRQHLQGKLEERLPQKRIVLADDNADMRDYVRTLLKNRYEIIAVQDGQQALEAVDRYQPDLLISDIMMPVMNGIELLKKVRATDVMKTLPVIFLSARAGEEAKVGGLEIGADDYLVKPFSAEELRARVNNLMAKRALEKELERSNQELEKFALVAAHDLNSPLRHIVSFGEILKRESGKSLSESSQDCLERMVYAASKLQQLIKDLLSYAKLHGNAKPPEKVALEDVIQPVLLNLETVLMESGGSVDVGELPTISADSSQMRQLFQNLISNALKYRRPEEPPHVVLTSEVAENGWVKIMVVDNGIGFDEKYAEQVFEPFRRLSNVGTYEGSGMGLAICQKIIQNHGGKITATSQLGKGSVFMVTLPTELSLMGSLR